MLENTHSVFAQEFHDAAASWVRFLEFLAVDNSPSLLYQLNHKFEWLFKDSKLVEKLKESYDPKLLRSDMHDHLGDMYLEKLVSSDNSIISSRQSEDKGFTALLGETVLPQQKKRYTFLDTAAGTGRLLMTVHERAPNAILFGVETDIRALRVAYTNFAIHGIKGYLLHADSSIHETDISTQNGKTNWAYANKWYSQMDKLLPLQEASQK